MQNFTGSSSCLRALVTAGGTSVPLDDVRAIGNRSKGGFGVALANELALAGIQVTLLSTEYARLKYRVNPKVSVIEFDTYQNYFDTLSRLASLAEQNKQPFDFVFLAAAVSDFAPVRTEGKISSDSRHVIECKALPKVIDSARYMFGKTSYIVGFKLHSLLRSDRESVRTRFAARERLVQTARKQNARAHLNLTIANFAPWGDQQDNTMYGVKPDGNVIEFAGSFDQRVRAIVLDVIKRQKTTWMRSESVLLNSNQLDVGSAPFALKFMQAANLFVGSSGNLTYETLDQERFLVTPRGRSDKGRMMYRLLVLVRPSFADGVMKYESNVRDDKPSIDSAVNTRVLSMIPQTIAMHFHDGWVLGATKTQTDYPCGTAEEAGAILEAITRHWAENVWDDPDCPTMIELTSHGHTLFCLPQDLDQLDKSWQAMQNEHDDHLRQVGQGEVISSLVRRPIWRQYQIVGLVAELPDKDWVSLYIGQDNRGEGLGAEVVQMAIKKHKLIGVHVNCQKDEKVIDYYAKFGYKKVDEENGVVILLPPSLQDKVIEAATIRVYVPGQQKLLMGQRSHGPWKEQWVNVGGVVKPGESPWQAALREAGEELVGFPSFVLEPKSRSIHYVAEPNTDRVFRVTCFHLQVPYEFPVKANEADGELLTCKWMTTEDLLGPFFKRPIGTRLSHADLFSDF